MDSTSVHRASSRLLLPAAAAERLKLVSTIVGSILVHVSLGSFYSAGNMIPYVVSYSRMRSSPANLQYGDSVWLFAAYNAGFGTGPILGAVLVTKIGPKWTAAVGELIMSCGLVATCYAVQANFYWVIFTNGFMCGFGIGVSYASPIQLSMQWLTKRKGLMTGLIVLGFGGSSFIFNQIQTAYVNPDNLPASLSQQNYTDGDAPSSSSLQLVGEMYFTDVDILNRVPTSFLLQAGLTACLQTIGTLMLFSPRADQTNRQQSSQTTVDSDCGETRPLQASEVSSIKKSESMRPLEVLRTRTFATLWAILFCNLLVVMFISALYKAFGLGIVNDDRALMWLGTVAALCSAFGRIIWGLVADRISYKAALLGLCGMMTLLTATTFVTQHAAKEMYYVWICAMNLCFCGNFVLFPLIVAAEFGKERLTVNYNMLFTCRVVTGVAGGLLSDSLSSLIGLVGIFELSAGFSAVAFLLTLSLHCRPAVCGERRSDARGFCPLRSSSPAAS